MAAKNITRVSLELGGKSANVVFADADMDQSVEPLVWSVFGNTGQDCCARSRVFVERPAYDHFVERSAEADRRARGSAQPLEEATQLGPLISAGQRQTSLDYLELGQKEGARLVTGGAARGAGGPVASISGRPCWPTSQRHGGSRTRRSSAPLSA